MINEEQFRAMALRFDGAVQGSHFDVTDFRVGDKIFATWRAKDGRAVLMLKPDQQQLLRETSAGMFEPVPGTWGLRGATRVLLAAIDEPTLRHAMAMAWQAKTEKPARNSS